MKRVGFGQVEPNHLSFQKTGQIWAQLPLDKTVKVLENGQFAKYDYARGEVNFDGTGEWLLVYNEIKLYDERKQFTREFAMLKEDYVDGVITPRLGKLNPGDLFTTNCFDVANTSGTAEVTMLDLAVGDKVAPNAKGYLTKTGGDTEYQLEVVKVYTMPDGQPGVKLKKL